MTDKERKSCICTIKMLRNLAFNVHEVMDVIDYENCEKMISLLERFEPSATDTNVATTDTISRACAIETVRKAKSIGQAHRMLMQLPSVDAVQVRCKDCKHRDPEDKKCDCGHDIMWQLPRGDDWYCADGEQKDGDRHEG